MGNMGEIHQNMGENMGNMEIMGTMGEVGGLCSMKKGILKNFTNFTGKIPLSCNLIKKRLQHRCFPLNIRKFLRTPNLK